MLMNNALDKKMADFLSSTAYAVVGASANREKYGNKVLRVYLQKHKKVIPVNPREKMIEGVKCVPNIQGLPNDVKSISIITPPDITLEIVKAAIQKGIQHIWMQPGAENQAAIELAENAGLTVIANGPCILVKLGFHEALS